MVDQSYGGASGSGLVLWWRYRRNSALMVELQEVEGADDGATGGGSV